MSAIPHTPKRFANWRKKQPAMPIELSLKADDAQIAHDILAANKNRKDFPAIKLHYRRAVLRFEEAYEKIVCGH